MGRSLRLAFSLLSALCVWLWGGLAAAHNFEAPQCDARAATTFGPAPVLQPLLASLDEVMSVDSGCESSLSDEFGWGQGQAGRQAPERAAAEAVTLPTLLSLQPQPSEPHTLSAPPSQWLFAASAHVRMLERPPR